MRQIPAMRYVSARELRPRIARPKLCGPPCRAKTAARGGTIFICPGPLWACPVLDP